jgi:hypothetical protein
LTVLEKILKTIIECRNLRIAVSALSASATAFVFVLILRMINLRHTGTKICRDIKGEKQS